MKKNKSKFEYLIWALIFGIIAVFFAYNQTIHKPVNPDSTQTIIFKINSGENLTTISKNLKEQNLIKSQIAFQIYSRFHNTDTSIKAGQFPISPAMTVPEIIESITNPKQGTIKFTIIEGQTIQSIDKSLAEAGLIKPEEFITAAKTFANSNQFDFLPKTKDLQSPFYLEGYLFPDTYFIDPSTFNSEEFIIRLLNNFKEKALPKIESNIPDNRTIHEIVTMASIIELEALGTTDSPIISGILWKRLDNGWFLGADATSLYLKDTKVITSKILSEESPYNTRKFQKGLPPGPIGNPGITALTAALNPAKTQYWYYLHTPTGETHYAETNDQHNINKARHL